MKTVRESPRWINIAPLFNDHVEELAADQRWLFDNTVVDGTGFICTLVPEGEPVCEKGTILAKRFRKYRELLKNSSGQCGLLFQATMGHGWVPDSEAKFTRTVQRDGHVPYIFCPLDKDFLAYVRRQARALVAEKPDFVMVDDDTRLITSHDSCFCDLHITEFSKRTGRTFTRDSLKAALAAEPELAEQWDILLRDSIAGLLRVVREEMDKVDPSMPGSFCCCMDDVQHSAYLAKIMAAPGQTPVVRLNNGRYCNETARDFPHWLKRTAMEVKVINDGGALALAEPDTCPQNRYSMSAADVHAHISLCLLEGCAGGKLWITRNGQWEPDSGRAYRDILKKYRGFYEKVLELAPVWEGIGAPLAQPPYNRKNVHPYSCSWGPLVLGRMGIPYFHGTAGKDGVNTIGLNDVEFDLFRADQIKDLLSTPVLMDGLTAVMLSERGYSDYLGFTAEKWSGPVASFEQLPDGKLINCKIAACKFSDLKSDVKVLSDLRHRSAALAEDSYSVGPGLVDYANPQGGRVCAFADTLPCMVVLSSFHFLNETRKTQLVNLLKSMYGGKLPFAYYPGDGEILLRWGRAKDGYRLMCAFNSGHDALPSLPIVFPDGEVPSSVSHLEPDGTWHDVPLLGSDNNANRIIRCEIPFLGVEVFRL